MAAWGWAVTPVDQTSFGDGAGGAEPGNCFAACVASLLDLPIAAVPNFATELAWFQALAKWSWTRGLWPFRLLVSPHLIEATPPSLCYIASGPGPRGFRHAVVMRDGALVHDPHPSRAGLASEPDNFYVFARLT